MDNFNSLSHNSDIMSELTPAPEPEQTEPEKTETKTEQTETETTPRSTYEERGEKTRKAYEKETGRESLLSKIYEKAKKNETVKKVLSAAAGIAVVGVLVASFVTGGPNNSSVIESTSTTSSISAEQETGPESLTGYEILDNTIDGSFLQYGNIGCYESHEKTADISVGAPNEVLRAIGINPDNATPEERGVVQEYFAYSMEEPAASVAIAGQLEGFYGLTQKEAEDKIHNMTAEEKTKLQSQLKDFFDHTSYHEEFGNGAYLNQYIAEDENGEKYSGFTESNLTGQKMLVGVTKFEDGTTIEWTSKESCGNNEDRIIITPPGGTPTVFTIPTTPSSSNPPRITRTTTSTSGTTPTTKTTDPSNPNTTSTTGTTNPSTPNTTTTTTQPGTTTTSSSIPQYTTTTHQQKNPENLRRIDENINSDIAGDIGTGDVVVTPNPGVREDEITDKPSREVYATRATTTQNADSRRAETITTTNPSNNYSENLGGTNPTSPNAVQDDRSAQEEANSRGDTAVTGNSELRDVLGDLGIF